MHNCIYVVNLQEIIQEQITRVVLERLIVNRPHPWGLLVTFIELVKVFFNCLYTYLLSLMSILVVACN